MTPGFSHTENLYAEAYLLIMKHQAAGGHILDGHVPSAEERRLKADMPGMLKEMERVMNSGTAADYVRLASLANAYSIDVFGRQIDFNTRHEGFKRLITLWLEGDKSASQEEIISLLQQLQATGCKAIDSKYNRWASDVQDKWLGELEHPELLEKSGIWHKRLSILLDENLWAYFCDRQRAEKSKWVNAFLVADLTELTIPDLTAYIDFLSRAAYYIGSDRVEQLQSEATDELISRPDLHPLLREAYLLTQSNITITGNTIHIH